MKKLIIEQPFWDIFPEAKIGVVICQGIDNLNKDSAYFQKLINDAQLKAQKHLTCENFTDNPVIKNWRNAYQKFKTKKGARASIEALLKRVKNGHSINSINPLVDIYNSISLEFGLPCGAEDIDQISGDMKLTNAQGDEEFITLGTNETTVPYKNEIVYKDESGTICRSLNWRESTRTIITEETKNAILCLELIEPERITELTKALEVLSTMISKNLNGQCQFKILDHKNNSMIIN